MNSLIITFCKTLYRTFKERRLLAYAGIYIVCVWVIATLIFHIFEKGSLLDSFYWSITTTTTVGYGDITPQTSAGKIASIIVMLSGVGVLALFLASFADILIEKTLTGRYYKKAHMEGHVIVCGWDKKLEIGVKELLSGKKEVVVVAEVDYIPIEHKHLMLITGDPSDEEVLKRANVEKASFALISGKDDVETLLVAIAVRRLNSTIHLNCVVSDPKVIQALKKTGVDQIVSTEEFFGLLLSRSIFVPKISELLNELLNTRGMDIYQEKNPEVLVGKTFLELVELFKEKLDAIIVGIVRENKVIANPNHDTKLEKEDELIYIAEEKLNISQRFP
jgi:voltage-gated potassium channel